MKQSLCRPTPTSHEIIKAMLDRGDELVPCMASDFEGDWSFVLIKRVNEWTATPMAQECIGVMPNRLTHALSPKSRSYQND